MRKLFFIMMAVMAYAFGLQAQTRTISGTVLDAATNEPLIGATVAPIGGGQAAATDIDGSFKISVPASVKQAKVSYVGYTPQTVQLKDGMTIKLASTSEVLDDVVVVAYGTQKKSSITGAISSVNSEEIAKRPVTDATAALEGSTPGITVTGSYGSPGSSPTVLIRGIGTVNGSTEPLYVVDGVPYEGYITDLNPDDIESMSVLKDAASAALYGNRASNGVILITTKKAKGEKLTLNFRTSQGWYERAIPEYDRTNVAQFMNVEYMNQANRYIQDEGIDRADVSKYHNDISSLIFGDTRLNVNYFTQRDVTKVYGLDGQLAPGVEILPEVAGDLNWFNQATRKGYRQEYVLNGAGSSSRSDYYFSVGYLNENGYMQNNSYDRLTGRAAVNINPLSWLRSGLNIQASHQKFNNLSNGVGDGTTSINNPFYYCRYIAPIYPVHQHYVADATYYDASGNPYKVNAGDYVLENGAPIYDRGYYTIYNENGTSQAINTRNQLVDRHVIWENELNKNRTKKNTMNSTGYIDFILPYGFTLTGKGNLMTSNSEATGYGSAVIGDYVARNGKLSKTVYNIKSFTFMEQINWNKTYGEHNIQVLLGHENYNYQYDYTYAVKDNEAFPNIEAFKNFSIMNSLDGYQMRYRTESYLARAIWNFRNTYNVEASFRRDGTSRFAKKTRWGNFGSIGANWIFSNETFMQPAAKWLTSGKIRADWGQVANDAGSGYYAYYALFSGQTQNSLPAYYLSQNAAYDLKWETSESWGVALETRLFNRWNLTVEYFDKRNKDLLFNVYAPLSAGATETDYATSTTTMNLGTITNRGIEISTDVDIFKNKDWKVNVGANLTYIQNKVLKLPEQNNRRTTLAADPSMQPPSGIISNSQFIAEGHGRYDWYTYHWAGVDMMTGRSLYDADLVKYHIETPDGGYIGGAYEVDNYGNPVYDADGDLVRVSTQLPEDQYVEIDGKYYVFSTTYAGKKWSGSALPKVYGSFSGNFGWKDFQLTAMFTYSLGGKIWDSNYASLMSVGSTPTNYHVDVLNSWNGVPEGMTEDSPNRINPNINPEINSNQSTNNNAGCDRWLVSRNYLCFKNINLSYTVPVKITRQWGIDRVQVSFSAENIHIWGARNGMNPMMDISGSQSNFLVPARVYTFGLLLNI